MARLASNSSDPLATYCVLPRRHPRPSVRAAPTNVTRLAVLRFDHGIARAIDALRAGLALEIARGIDPSACVDHVPYHSVATWQASDGSISRVGELTLVRAHAGAGMPLGTGLQSASALANPDI